MECFAILLSLFNTLGLGCAGREGLEQLLMAQPNEALSNMLMWLDLMFEIWKEATCTIWWKPGARKGFNDCILFKRDESNDLPIRHYLWLIKRYFAKQSRPFVLKWRQANKKGQSWSSTRSTVISLAPAPAAKFHLSDIQGLAATSKPHHRC